ncbi:MAG: DUF1501 domain-containing protein, partial [Thermomicrobiales bacterium]
GRFPNDRNNRVDTFKALNGGSGQGYDDFIRRAALEALDSSAQLKKVAASYKSTVIYPENAFARGLQMIAKILSADLGTKVFHITIGGFDTHAGQSRTHGLLLKTVAEGAQAFLRDIEGFGRADDVMLMTFSEFGRRVMENGSQGTDHGTAAPLYIMGGGMNPGVFGDAPSLADLDSNGDLKFKLDFRSVYGTLVQDWLGGDTTNLIGAGSFPRIGFVRAPASTSRASDEQASRVAVAALAAK